MAFKFSSKSSERELLEALAKADNDQHTLNMRYIRVIEYDLEHGLGILRCDHRVVDALRSSLGKISGVSTAFSEVKVLGVSGTIRALRRKFVKLPPKEKL